MRKIIAVIMTSVLIAAFTGCSYVPKNGKNNINKYTYAEENEAAEVTELSNSDFNNLLSEGTGYTIDDMNKKFGLGTIRQTVIEDGNFIAYSVYQNKNGDRLYVLFDHGLYILGEYVDGWSVYHIIRFDADKKTWQNDRFLSAIYEIDMPDGEVKK